jgi:hypothetical protein
MTKPLYFWNGTAFEAIGPIVPQSPIAYQTSAPTGPATGDLWVDSDSDVDTYTRQLTRYKFVASGGETSLSGADANNVTLAYTPGAEQVYLNGALLNRGSDYVATNGTSITSLSPALVANDIVEIFAYVAFNPANSIAPTLVDAKGDLIAGTAADTVGRLAVGTNNQLLTADSSTSTGLKWANGGLTLITTQSFSGVTSSSVNDVFSATYLNYVIILNMNEVATSGNLALRLRVSGSDAATNYNNMVLGTDTAGAQSIVGAGATSAQFSNQNAGANSRSLSVLYVGEPFSAVLTEITTTSTTRRAGGNWTNYTGGVNHTDNTSYTGFTLLNAAGGNIAGTVRVYGVNN